MSQPSLIATPTDQACRQKWEAGRKVYGPTFQGHPLIELDFEIIDGLNYEEEATRQGYQMGIIRETLLALRRRVQDIYQSQRPKPIKSTHSDRP